MAGSSWLSSGSSIYFSPVFLQPLFELVCVQTGIFFYPLLKFMAGAKSDHASRRDGNFLASFGIAPGTGVFLAQREVTETGKLHLLPFFQGFADFLEENLNEFLGFALVQAQFIEQVFG